MTTRTTKLALLTTVSAAAAAFIMPGTAAAQAVCAPGTATATNNIINCVNGTSTIATGTTDLTTTVAAGSSGQGLALTSSGSQTSILTITAPYATTLNAGVSATSGGAITFTSTGAISTSGGGFSGNALYFDPTTSLTANVGNLSTSGSNAFGVRIDSATAVSLTTGTITTTGGGGAIGVFVNGGSGPTNITTGALNTTGSGVEVGAFSTVTGPVTVNTGAITTTGGGSKGVFVNTDGAVSVTTASVSTNGVDADGVQIATIGAVTTNTGNITTLGADSVGLLVTGGTGNVAATFGNITTAGTGASYPVLINTTGGNIAITGGNVTATGANQIGINLVSTTGAITGTTGTITANGAGSQGLVIAGGTGGAVTLTTGAISAAGNGIAIDNGADPITLTTGAVTSTEAGAIATRLNSTGAITFTGGLQRANAADALQINGGAGAIGVTVAGATTTGAGADGVQITGTGPLTFSNTGTVTTAGAGSRGVAISGVTTAAVTCGNISTTGANSPAFDLSANGNTTVTCGTLSTTGTASDGINITNASGTTTVTGGTTTVSGDGSLGIDVATGTNTGAITINTGVVTSTATNSAAQFNFASVLAVGAGPITVNATGNVSATTGSGIWVRSTGSTATVVVNPGVTVSGPLAVTLAGQTGNILTVNGTINSNTAGAAAYQILGPGPLALTIGAAGTVGGPLTFTAGNDVFTNNRTAGYTQVGTIDFLAGDDIFNNNTVFNHAGIVQFGAGDDRLNNAGTLNLSSAAAFDFGANTTVAGDVFNNTGTLTLFNGAQTLANLESFLNAGGLIDLRDGAGNDTLTIPGNYTASLNARLGIDVVGTTNLNVADRLVIGGITAGTTTVLAAYTNPVIDPTGALVIDSSLNNLVGTGNFVLGGTNSFGLINYSLENRGGDIFIVSRPDEVVFDQVFVGRMANDIWYQSAEAYQSYAMSRRIDYGNERKGPVGIWAQLYGSRERFGDRSRSATAFNTTLATSSRFETKRRGAQTGLDFGAQNFVVGVTAGYEHAKGDTDFGTGLDLEGYNYGAYAQFGAKQGIYAGLLLKRDDYDIRIVNNSVGALMVNPDGRSTGVDGEAGLRFGNPGSINFDVGAGLSYVRSRTDAYRFGNVNFDGQRHTSTRGRLQARASFAGTLAPFIDGKLFREFGDANDVFVRSGALTSTIEDQKRGTWGRIEAGLGGGAGGGPLFSGFVDLGDVKGYGVRGGFRF